MAVVVMQAHGTMPHAGSFDLDRMGGAMMSRIKVLNEVLWRAVPEDVVREAEHAAEAEPCWIVMQSNGHVVATEGPGSPDVATGDITYIAEVAPRAA